MQDAVRDTASANLGIAARDRRGLRRLRNRMPGRQVRAHHERVNLGRVPAQHRALVRVRENLRLHEVTGRERLRKRARLTRVVERVLVELFRLVLEIMADLRRVDIHAILARQPEMLGKLLQPEALQLAARNVVVLREDPRIDDAAARDVVAAVSDRTFGNLHARRPRTKLAAIAPQPERHPMAARPRLQVFEIEAKQIVPFDDVRIAIMDDSHHLLEHRALVHLGALEQALETGRVGERDRDHPVALARR